MRSIDLVVLAVAGAAFVACSAHSDNASDASSSGATSSSASSSSTGGGSPSAVEACAAFAKASCGELDACTNHLGVEVVFGDEQTCESREGLACTAALGAAGTSATPAGVTACATALSSEECSSYWDGDVLAACAAAPGSSPAGAPCSAAAQCATSYCAPTSGSACGTCAAPPSAGASCSFDAECAPGFVCAGAPGMMGACASPSSNGAACTYPSECTAGSTCVGANPKTSQMGACASEASAVGASCDATLATMSDCDPHLGLYCGADGTCHATILSGPGMTCGIIGSGSQALVAACKDGSLCVVAQGKVTGKCVAPAADGAACDLTAGPPCLPPALCVNGACVEPACH